MRKKAPKVIGYNPPFSSHGYENIRWVENASEGLRRIGFADEIARLNHRGWFIHDDEGMSGEVYRGIVFQLPARRGGLPRYVIGYDDPNNDDCALLCFEDQYLEKEEAARAADRFAEIFAEEARDIDRAWQAGRRCEAIEDEVKEMRAEALALAEEMRAAKRAPIVAPRICAVLRGKILSLYRAIQKVREERDELRDNYGEQEGFSG